jgi:hypothetical protein
MARNQLSLTLEQHRKARKRRMERLGIDREATFDSDFAVYRFGRDRRRAFTIVRQIRCLCSNRVVSSTRTCGGRSQ